jgi:hypothetical protein
VRYKVRNTESNVFGCYIDSNLLPASPYLQPSNQAQHLSAPQAFLSQKTDRAVSISMLQQGRSKLKLHILRKIGERVVVPRVATTLYLERVRSLRGESKPSDLVFRMSDGSAVTTLIDQFNVVLALAGLTHNSASGSSLTLGARA